jgi:uncharacterized protein
VGSVQVEPSPQDVSVDWAVSIALRDGVHLNAAVYVPRRQAVAHPAIFLMTPYVAQTYHDFAMYFAANGYTFVVVDVRGRGNSEGVFRPFVQEAQDGCDVVRWLTAQPYCNGQVAMWGGSYSGCAQWSVAKERPSGLATVVPVASVYPGVDFPCRGNVFRPYVMQWLNFVSGRTLQDKIFAARTFWAGQFRAQFESGASFATLDVALGQNSAIFQEWLAHPQRDAYWDGYNPTAAQYAEITIPILTITGMYDGDQPGALLHHQEHLRNNPAARHYLVIGPWDHAGTRAPKAEFGGLKFGPASLVDLPRLHLEWYRWTMQGGARPNFLQNNVAYYVTGAERWRYADNLDAATSGWVELRLASTTNPVDVFRSGSLSRESLQDSEPDQYVYDPRDSDFAALESTVDPADMTDARMVHALVGKQLLYHSEPFDCDTEITGFFRLSAWLSIDQLDTDIRAWIYEVGLDGSSTQLTSDWIRARYRKSLREAQLVRTTDPLHYMFDHFAFVSRRIAAGHRLRLVIGPINSIYWQRNHNAGGMVSNETIEDARTVTVRLFHDADHRSVLHVPLGQPET